MARHICFNQWFGISRSRSWRRIAWRWDIIRIGVTISSSTGALERDEHGRALGGPRLSVGSELRYKHRGATLQRRLWSCTKWPWLDMLNSWVLWSQQYRRRLHTKLRGHIIVSLLLLRVSFQYLRGRVAAAGAKVQTETLRHFSSRPTAPVPTLAGCSVFPSGSRLGLLRVAHFTPLTGWLIPFFSLPLSFVAHPPLPSPQALPEPLHNISSHKLERSHTTKTRLLLQKDRQFNTKRVQTGWVEAAEGKGEGGKEKRKIPVWQTSRTTKHQRQTAEIAWAEWRPAFLTWLEKSGWRSWFPRWQGVACQSYDRK